jgi:hypothetical protein
MPTEIERQEMDLFLKRRRRRSIALGLALGGLVILFYILTFVKMSVQHSL